MKVTAKRNTFVTTLDGRRVLLEKGESVEIDGRSGQAKSAYLEAERQPEKPKKAPKTEPPADNGEE